jgi:hypothetical protein
MQLCPCTAHTRAVHVPDPRLGVAVTTTLHKGLHRVAGGGPTGIVPLTFQKRTCRATHSPDIRTTWPSPRSHRRRMVAPMWCCCVQHRTSSMLMPSLPLIPRMLRRHQWSEHLKQLQLRGCDRPRICLYAQHTYVYYIVNIVMSTLPPCRHPKQLTSILLPHPIPH